MTISINSNLKQNIMLFSIIYLIFLFITSCEPQEPPIPSNATVIASDSKRQIEASTSSDVEANSKQNVIVSKQSQDLSNNIASFSLIKIQHFSSESNNAEWNVTVNNAGLVTFEGKRNCAFNSTVSFNSDARVLPAIMELYFNSKFFSITETLSDEQSPVFATTCFENHPLRGKTIRDDGKGSPAALVYFRTKIVMLLNISRYIGTEKEKVPAATAAQS